MTAVWGSTFVLIKDVVSRMPVADFLAVRFSVAAVAMLALFARQAWRLGRPQILRGLLLGTIYGIGQLLQTWGLSLISPSVSGFATGMYVVFGAGSGSLTFAFRMQHVNPAWSLDGSRGARADVGKTVGQLAPRSFKLVVFLQVHPALRIGAEVARQAQGCVGGNAAPFAHDLIYARGRDADGIGKRCAGQAEWHHEFLAEDFARMDRREFCGHVNSSMVVNDLYIAGVAVLPAKAHAKLVVDADAVLAGKIGRAHV